jgi:hypothetical protein
VQGPRVVPAGLCESAILWMGIILSYIAFS